MPSRYVCPRNVLRTHFVRRSEIGTPGQPSSGGLVVDRLTNLPRPAISLRQGQLASPALFSHLIRLIYHVSHRATRPFFCDDTPRFVTPPRFGPRAPRVHCSCGGLPFDSRVIVDLVVYWSDALLTYATVKTYVLVRISDMACHVPAHAFPLPAWTRGKFW